MYPGAADLGSVEVQRYSERKLFWIVKNGVRLSGMPAFGRVESDEHIWDLVHFVRTLPMNEIAKGEATTHWKQVVGLKKLVLPGIDFTFAKQMAKSAHTAIQKGQLGYAVLIAAKPDTPH
jgi:Cytochrome C oxidase, cbb3-type, subunit III